MNRDLQEESRPRAQKPTSIQEMRVPKLSCQVGVGVVGGGVATLPLCHVHERQPTGKIPEMVLVLLRTAWGGIAFTQLTENAQAPALPSTELCSVAPK